MHLVGWLIWIVWWCTDLQTLKVKYIFCKILFFWNPFVEGAFVLNYVAPLIRSNTVVNQLTICLNCPLQRWYFLSQFPRVVGLLKSHYRIHGTFSTVSVVGGIYPVHTFSHRDCLRVSLILSSYLCLDLPEVIFFCSRCSTGVLNEFLLFTIRVMWPVHLP